MNYGALPPEINSGRMYAGPGPGPMLGAAANWADLAAELRSAATAFRTEISELADRSWQGPSATSMAAAANSYTSWLIDTSTQAELTAGQARAAATAYEAAFAATVPPPVIAANRTLLATLVATNLLGQNTSAIAAAETAYAEMWAQDATAMNLYAVSSAAAANLPAFTSPPSTTTGSDTADQSATLAHAGVDSASASAQSQLTQLGSQLGSALQTLATGTSAGAATTSTTPEFVTDLANFSTLVSNLTGAYSPIGLASIPGGMWLTTQPILGMAQNGPGAAGLLLGAKPVTGALEPLAIEISSTTMQPALAGSTVPTPMGQANSIGGLSVPARWVEAAPEARSVATRLASGMRILALGELDSAFQFDEMLASSLVGRGAGATAGLAAAGRPARSAARRLPASVSATGPTDDTMLVVVPPKK